MFNVAKQTSVLLLVLALAACGGGSGGPQTGTGNVKFHLVLPGGQIIKTVESRLVCAASGIDLMYTLDVVNGEVIAIFGGLAPGECTITMTTKSEQGRDCRGSRTFTVLASSTVDVPVSLTCKGVNTSPAGAAKVTGTLEPKACTEGRIKTVYAAPGNLTLGESTVVQVQVFTEALVGTPKFTFSVRNDAGHTGQGTLAESDCRADSAACRKFTCTGLGDSPGVDPRTELPAAGVFVSVEYEDDECFDTEEVWVNCLDGGVCGNGTKEGVEGCDDGNTANNDGCSATCKVESCGDGVVQTGEECDGSAGVGEGQTCSSACKLVTGGAAPVCGDGIVNQASETCDGAAGLQANQQCGTDCKIVPICGNDIVEGNEQCDSGTNPACVDCKLPQGETNQCEQCMKAYTELKDFKAMSCDSSPLCTAALSCILTKKTCWGLSAASCYCGNTPELVEACEMPDFQPMGDCSAELKAGAGAGATNADVLNRFFDPEYPTGNAGLIVNAIDVADDPTTPNLEGCKAACF